ncbi:DEAD/DEAH box helicase, partial [bacterium]
MPKPTRKERPVSPDMPPKRPMAGQARPDGFRPGDAPAKKRRSGPNDRKETYGANVDSPASEPEPEILTPLPLFSELGLSDNLLRAITERGFESPTPIQARAIPVLLQGGDLIGQAQTGTGKTAAFALPIIEKIDPALIETQALVLAPTRELAVQVAGGIYDLAKNSNIRVVPVYGGQPIDRQFRALKSGAHVVVGTPGRLLDHLRRGSLNLENVRLCVLDEADEMMALGFTEDMDAILALLPENRQLAFFSATMPARIVALTKKYLRNPQHVAIESKRRTVDAIQQTYYEVPKGQKLEALARVLDMESPGPTIVFCRTRQETNDLSDALRLRGYNAEALHGDMNQGERDRTMRRFRDGQADLLVATDVAARGLDIETVTHVVNYDIPMDVEQYIHRVGRTGRAGRDGDAITLVEGRQYRQLQNIERMIGTKIKLARIPTAADIAARRRDQFKESLRENLTARK